MFGIALKAALGALSGVPRWIYLSVAAIAALGLLWALHGHWEHKAYNDAFNAGWSKQKLLTNAEIAKNTVNLRSIGELRSDLAAMTARSDARAQALADAKAQDMKDRAAFDKQYAATAGRVEQLEAIARVPGVTRRARLHGLS